MKDQDFIDEIYYFSEDETDKKIKNIYEYIKTHDNFLEVLNSHSLSSFRLDEDVFDDDFYDFVSYLYRVFSYDITMSSLYNTKSLYSHPSRDNTLQNVYYFCRDYLIKNMTENQDHGMLALVKVWDSRKGSSFELIKFDYLQQLKNEIIETEEDMVLITDEKYIDSYVNVPGAILTFFNPENQYSYYIAKMSKNN